MNHILFCNNFLIILIENSEILSQLSYDLAMMNMSGIYILYANCEILHNISEVCN